MPEQERCVEFAAATHVDLAAAHLTLADLDGAEEHLEPVLRLPAENGHFRWCNGRFRQTLCWPARDTPEAFKPPTSVSASPCSAPTPVLRTLRHETSSVPEIREHAIEWHAKILASVAKGEADEAREMMRGHLIQTENDMDHFLGQQQIAHATLG